VVDGGFLVSSKTGKNINESMEFLLNKIIERLEGMKNTKKFEDLFIPKYGRLLCKKDNLLKFINK
jgi:hypothetical protein